MMKRKHEDGGLEAQGETANKGQEDDQLRKSSVKEIQERV
jgi:hypothetical protein